MRILFFTRLFYPHIGGVEKHVWEVSKILQKEGHAITILCERHDKNLKLSETIDGIAIKRFDPYQNEKFKKFSVWFYILRNFSLMKNADSIHIHDVFFWYLPFAFLFSTKKVYLTFHGYEGIYPIKKNAIRIRQISQKFARGTIAVGKYIEKWYGTTSDFVTYGGVHQRNNKITKLSSPVKILFLGRLDRDNDCDVYLKALENLKSKKIQFELTICGDGLYKEKFEKYGNVVGFVSNSEYYLKETDIVFASSYLSILEALNYGKHVFSVFTNPLKEDYLKMTPFSLYIHIASDATQLSSQIINLLSSEDKEQIKIERGKEWVSSETWENVAELYKKLWKK